MPRSEDWAPVDRCDGQFDGEALHVNFCQPLAVLEPPPTDAMASPKEMAEPTTYTFSRLGRLRYPSMTEVWGRVSTWPLELSMVLSAKPCRPQVPQIWRALTFLSAEPCRPQVPQIRQAGHLRERQGYRMLPECAELPPELGRATRVKSPLQYHDGPHRRANNPPPYEGEGVDPLIPGYGQTIPRSASRTRQHHLNVAREPSWLS
jgi:hypothetical protein